VLVDEGIGSGSGSGVFPMDSSHNGTSVDHVIFCAPGGFGEILSKLFNQGK
jgi:hypothetical protein